MWLTSTCLNQAILLSICPMSEVPGKQGLILYSNFRFIMDILFLYSTDPAFLKIEELNGILSLMKHGKAASVASTNRTSDDTVIDSLYSLLK